MAWPEDLAEALSHLGVYGYSAEDAENWEEAPNAESGEPPQLSIKVTGHDEIEGHTHYKVECSMTLRGQRRLDWQVSRRLTHLRSELHDAVKVDLGAVYGQHFDGKPFAGRGGMRGTTATLDIWCQALSACINAGCAPPRTVARALRFFQVPEPLAATVVDPEKSQSTSGWAKRLGAEDDKTMPEVREMLVSPAASLGRNEAEQDAEAPPSWQPEEDEERRRQEEEEENARIAEEKRKEEQARLAEEKRRKEEEARHAEEQQRQEEERLAEEKRKQEYEEARLAEEKRIKEEEEKARQAERRRQEEEARALEEEKRKREEEEKARLEEEKRKEEERLRLEDEKRQAEEEEARRKEEEEKKRLEEMQRAEAEEKERAEEARRKQAEEDRQREEEERQRKEEEEQRREEEAAEKRRELEEKQRKEEEERAARFQAELEKKREEMKAQEEQARADEAENGAAEGDEEDIKARMMKQELRKLVSSGSPSNLQRGNSDSAMAAAAVGATEPEEDSGAGKAPQQLAAGEVSEEEV